MIGNLIERRRHPVISGDAEHSFRHRKDAGSGHHRILVLIANRQHLRETISELLENEKQDRLHESVSRSQLGRGGNASWITFWHVFALRNRRIN